MAQAVREKQRSPSRASKISRAQAVILTLLAGLTGLTCLLLWAAVLWYFDALPDPSAGELPVTGSLPASSPGGGNVFAMHLAASTQTRTPFQPVPYTATPTVTHTPTASPSPTTSPSPTPTSTASPTSTETPTQTPSPSATPTPGSSIPDQASISGVIGYPQSLPLSCEARSAVDWAAYHGVSIGEMEFQYGLPSSDNPNRGFVGIPAGQRGQIPPASYGVHAAPVAALLRSYGVSAQERYGLSWDEVRQEVASGDPVIAWVIGNVWRGYGVSYTASDGETLTVAPYEHTVIIVAYTPDSVTVVDGELVYSASLERFLSSWSVLGNMAILQE